MKRKMILVLGFILTTSFIMAGCSSSGSGTTPSSYNSAVVGAGEESGELSVSLRAASANLNTKASSDTLSATATLTVEGETVDLTGTYNSTDKSLSLSGEGYVFTGATTTDGKLSGNYTNASGDGIFSGFDSSSYTVTVYCGTYASDNCEDPNCSGIWDITTSSHGYSSGTYLGNGGQSGILWGTFTGNQLDAVDDYGSICTGTLTDGVINGTWELTDAVSGKTTGTFTATVCP